MTRASTSSRPARARKPRPAPADRERLEHHPRCECGKCGQMTMGHPVHVSRARRHQRLGWLRDCTAYFACCRVLVQWSIASTPDGGHDGERVSGPQVHQSRSLIEQWLRLYPELRTGD